MTDNSTETDRRTRGTQDEIAGKKVTPLLPLAVILIGVAGLQQLFGMPMLIPSFIEPFVIPLIAACLVLSIVSYSVDWYMNRPDSD